MDNVEVTEVGEVFDGRRRFPVSGSDRDMELSKLSRCDIVRYSGHCAPQGWYQRHFDGEFYYVYLGDNRTEIMKREGWNGKVNK